MHRSTRHDAGFSLLEILIAMAILSMVLAIAIPFSRKPDDAATLRAKATSMTAQLLLLRSKAQMTGRSMTVTFDVARRSYSSDLGAIRSSLPEGVSMQIALPRGTAANKAHIIFYPDGSATAVRIKLQARGLSCTIETMSLTGSVLFEGCKS